MSKGPAPPATVFVPLLLWIALFHRTRPVLWSIPVMLLIALAVALPWVIAIINLYPEVWAVWQKEALKLSTGRRDFDAGVDTSLRDPWYYYVSTFIWVTPLTPTLIAGLTFGGVLAYASSRLIDSRLYGIAPQDPLTVTSAAVLLAAVALIATYLPAQRASKVDPMLALRQQ